MLDLQCAHGHAFEGWFASHDDFDLQFSRGLVECPVCGERSVEKLPSAPNLHFGNNVRQAGDSEQRAPSADGRWLRAMRRLMEGTEDVGGRFTDEARRIHYGEVPERGIRGHATREQAKELEEEGISVVALALPAALKETLQ